MTQPATVTEPVPTASRAHPFTELSPLARRNLRIESVYSALNGILVGMVFIAGPVMARTAVGVSKFELTLLFTSFPIGAAMGPFWAYLGRRWGMKELVTRCQTLAGSLLLLIFFTSGTLPFTLLLGFSQLLLAPIRLGQSSLYGTLYSAKLRGRVLGRFVMWTYVTMVPAILIAGYLADADHSRYRWIYPAVGMCGLLAAWCYSRLQLPTAERLAPFKISLRAGLRKAEQVLRHNPRFLWFEVAFFLSGSAFFMSQHLVIMSLQKAPFMFGPAEIALWLSVVPQVLLAIGSPVWGRIVDRFGIARSRVIVASILSGYLVFYFWGIVTGMVALIFIGSVLFGMTSAGGQITWYLGSSHYAPHLDEVPVYHGIHLFLNGMRGLMMPWIGTGLYLIIGTNAILVALGVSLCAIPVGVHLIRISRETVVPYTKPLESQRRF